MELSPEDRQRIYAEEKARVEAQSELKAAEVAEKNKKAAQGGIGCLVIVVVLYAIGSFSSSDKSPKKSENSDRSFMAYLMAQDFIKEKLKAPGSAEFPSMTTEPGSIKIVRPDDSAYRVSAWVDSQNSFGAKLRAPWSCALRELPDGKWQVVGSCGLIE
jgi:hypothetical protein